MNLKNLIAKNPLFIYIKMLLIKLTGFFPINPKKIVFDNFGGRGFGDDPKYIAKELLQHSGDLVLIWMTTNPKIELPIGIKAVKYGTVRAAFHWSTARVWVDNIKNTIRPPKRVGQYYIQTWHSTLGFKKNEQDAKALTEKYRRQAETDAGQTDLMYSDNDFRWDKYKNRYWYHGEVIKCDVPRMSVMLKPPADLKQSIRKVFNISESDQIVLYAPTFRSRTDLSAYIFDYRKCIKSLEAKFGGRFKMLVRLHPNEAKKSADMHIYDSDVINASGYGDMQELLAVSDVLITDYSGCMFDFGFTRKPVFLFAKDYENYTSQDRGSYFSIEEVPFALARTEAELWRKIDSFNKNDYCRKCEDFEKKIGYRDNGNGASHLAAIIFSKLRRNK